MAYWFFSIGHLFAPYPWSTFANLDLVSLELWTDTSILSQLKLTIFGILPRKAHLSCLPSVFSFLIAFMAWGRNSFSSDGLFLLCFFLEFSSRPLFWLSKFLWRCHKLIDIFQYCQGTLHWSFQEHLPCFGCGRVSFNHEISLFGINVPYPIPGLFEQPKEPSQRYLIPISESSSIPIYLKWKWERFSFVSVGRFLKLGCLTCSCGRRYFFFEKRWLSHSALCCQG